MANDASDRLSRREVLQAAGSAGFAAVGIASMSGTASANCSGPCEPVTLGKLDSPEIGSLERGTTSEFTLTLDSDKRIADDCDACQGDKEITVQVTPTEFKDEDEGDEDEKENEGDGNGRDPPENPGNGRGGPPDSVHPADVRVDSGDAEVTEVELRIDDTNGKCKCADDGLYFSGATVKGGPDVAEYDCSDTNDENQDFSSIPNAAAPTNPNNGKRYGISNIVIEVCVFPNCYEPGQTNCANGGGS